MENLAGAVNADISIQEELHLAGIEKVKGERSTGEVTYSITGKLENWTLTRAWYYWMASAPDGEGLPLEVATELYERQYPISGERQPTTYGQVVRAAGDADCRHPNIWSKNYDAEGRKLVVDPKGEQEAQAKALMEGDQGLRQDLEGLRFVPNLDGVVAKSLVNSYHIDSQVGLNEFALVVKKLSYFKE